MNTTDYAQHIRHAMLHTFMDQLSETPDNEIINQDFNTLTQQHPEISRENFNRAIIEGTSPLDCHRLLGLPTTVECSSCGHEQEIDEDDEMSEADEIENDIIDRLVDVLEDISDFQCSSFILSYGYISDNAGPADNIRGQTFVFGPKGVLKHFKTSINDQIEANTDERGWVDNLFGTVNSNDSDD